MNVGSGREVTISLAMLHKGGNCEAAVILHGDANERPFVDALNHLIACRNEAKLYDPDAPPPNVAERADTVVIHAEFDSLPKNTLPWHVHLCLNSAEFDGLLRTPSELRLFLYPRGSLRHGWRFAVPAEAYAGSLTGLNLTASNPRASRAGTPAAWNAATFRIIESSDVLRVVPDAPPDEFVTTQAVFYVDRNSDREEDLFSEAPKIVSEPVPGERRLSNVDDDMRRFFQKGFRSRSESRAPSDYRSPPSN